MSTTKGVTDAEAARLGRTGTATAHGQLSDHELIPQLARGDEAALAELYDRHGRMAYSLALRITQDCMLAQDAVQEAFLQVWRGAAAIDPERTGVAAWIVLLTRRRAIDLLRHHTRVGRPPPLLEREAPAAEEHALVLVESLRARAALRTLSPDQLAVIELAYYSGLSQSEIATALHIPIGTVKSRTHTALNDLRAALSDHAPDGSNAKPAVVTRLESRAGSSPSLPEPESCTPDIPA